MPWLACHNPKIDQKTEEVKMTRYIESSKGKSKKNWDKRKIK